VGWFCPASVDPPAPRQDFSEHVFLTEFILWVLRQCRTVVKAECDGVSPFLDSAVKQDSETEDKGDAKLDLLDVHVVTTVQH